jgi:hypothetical protein
MEMNIDIPNCRCLILDICILYLTNASYIIPFIADIGFSAHFFNCGHQLQVKILQNVVPSDVNGAIFLPGEDIQ